MRTATVAIPCPLDQLFTYEWPFLEDVPAGCRISVPFGPRTVVGLLISLQTEELDQEVLAKIKPVTEILDREPIWDDVSWNTWNWMAGYYCHPIGDALTGILPPPLRKGGAIPVDALKGTRDFSGVVTYQVADTSNVITPTQKKLIKLVTSTPSGMTRSEMEREGASGRVIDTLIRIGALKPDRMRDNALTLTAEQQSVTSTIADGLAGGYQTHLIDGVTGSGKTEVYLQLIERVVEQDKQVLYLVPEINLTPQTCARLEARFGDDVVVMHSGMNENERLAAWARSRAGLARIIVGTRSALFTPLPRLGLIILDEEHDTSYKQTSHLRYHARDVAIYLAHRRNVPIVLGSATPSAETLRNALAGKVHRHRMLERATGMSVPKLLVIDATSMPHPDGLTQIAMRAIKRTLEAGEQAMVYLPRRGFAHALFCRACGWASECPHCSARMTMHKAKGKLICHHCGHTRRLPHECPECQGEVIGLGAGTERAEALLIEAFGEDAVLRFDTDTLGTPRKLQEALALIRSNRPLVVVGTQMIAKGHDFPNVTLTVITGTDGALFSAEPRAAERVIQQIVQVAGRSGRTKQGHVMVQTMQPLHPVLTQLVNEGYHATMETLIRDYEERLLPPAVYSALITIETRDPREGERLLDHVIEEIDHPDLLGPFPAVMERKAQFTRYQAIILSSTRATRHMLARQVQAALRRVAPRARAFVDIDPA